MAALQNKTPIKVFVGVIVMITLSFAKAYVLMPYVYDAFSYELYHFSCSIVAVFIAMAGMCFIHLSNLCDISYTRKCNYPLFILSITAIIEALIFLMFLLNDSAYYIIEYAHQALWSPLYLAVELAILAWIIYNGFISISFSDVCNRLLRYIAGSRNVVS